jgi:hypothetical protein
VGTFLDRNLLNLVKNEIPRYRVSKSKTLLYDFLEIARGFLKDQHRIKIGRQSLRKPRIKKLVAVPKGDRPPSNQRHNLALTNPTEKVIPKGIV